MQRKKYPRRKIALTEQPVLAYEEHGFGSWVWFTPVTSQKLVKQANILPLDSNRRTKAAARGAWVWGLGLIYSGCLQRPIMITGIPEAWRDVQAQTVRPKSMQEMKLVTVTARQVCDNAEKFDCKLQLGRRVVV
jgi:hypothetical protein